MSKWCVILSTSASREYNLRRDPGSLISGKGTRYVVVFAAQQYNLQIYFALFRYVLASTEKLHAKISQMSERIQELELALQLIYEEHCLCSVRYQTHAECQIGTTPTHPLLQDDKLLVKNHMELYGEVQEPDIASSPNVFHPEGQQDSEENNTSTPEASSKQDVSNHSNDERERTSGSSPIQALAGDADLAANCITQARRQPSTNVPPTTISALSSSFLTVSRNIAFEGLDAMEIRRIRPSHSRLKFARTEILDTLPPREEAERLCNVAQEIGFIMYVPPRWLQTGL